MGTIKGFREAEEEKREKSLAIFDDLGARSKAEGEGSINKVEGGRFPLEVSFPPMKLRGRGRRRLLLSLLLVFFFITLKFMLFILDQHMLLDWVIITHDF